MNYQGVIIEESLEDINILQLVKILKTKVEPVTDEHQSPWLKQWTLHTIEVSEELVEKVAKKISKSLDKKHNWYADFKNNTTAFIIFRNKIFRVDRYSQKQYDEAKQYGISLGIPEYQVDFKSI